MEDYGMVALQILAAIGGSSIVAAYLPLKFRRWLPLVTLVIDKLAQNYGTAQNKSPDDIEVDRQIEKSQKTRNPRKYSRNR